MLQNCKTIPPAAMVKLLMQQGNKWPLSAATMGGTLSCQLGSSCSPASPGVLQAEETPIPKGGKDMHLQCALVPAAACSHCNAEDTQHALERNQPPPPRAHVLRSELTFLGGKNLPPLIPLEL